MLTALTIDSIDSTLASPLPVAVYFTSTTCVHCRMVTPLLETFVDEYADRLTIVKVEVEDVAQWCQDLNIRSIPRIVVFAGGKEVKRFDARTRNDMRRELDAAVAAAQGELARMAASVTEVTAAGDKNSTDSATDNKVGSAEVTPPAPDANTSQ